MLNQNSHVGECGDTVPIYLVSTSSLKLQYGEIGKGCGAGCAASCDPARQPSAASVLWDRRLFGLPGSAGGGLPSGRAYCLMPNHVHLILVPLDTEGLRAALAETHRRYTTRVILREGWRGYLWQGRFASFPMDEAHVLVCARYVELNPVRARLARRARDWRWSSASVAIPALVSHG